MENAPTLTIAQRLAIEKQLLREEKYIVNALKMLKAERYSLQREQADMLCLLKEVLSQGTPRKATGEKGASQPEMAAASLELELPTPEDMETTLNDALKFTSMDDFVNNDVELNLTVPNHEIYDHHVLEEFDEVEAEDDYEIEMAMLMNGGYGKGN